MSGIEMVQEHSLNIGTCSWKYDDWRGLIYPETGAVDYLKEYGRRYRTVEVDQWFWSLFAGDVVVLPKPSVVRTYAESVPVNFTFCIKVPNSITLTHHYAKNKKTQLLANPHFLSAELLTRFLETLQPLGDRIGPLVFQFEYLNKNKMPGLGAFLEQFASFAAGLPAGYRYCLEIRNPNYLCERYFAFLADFRLHHVFCHGYYMPSIFEVFKRFRHHLSELTVIRLLGPDRTAMKTKADGRWHDIVEPRDDDLDRLTAMLTELSNAHVQTFLYVNNHFEGSAPRTIERLENRLHRL